MSDIPGKIRFLYLVFLALLVWSFMVYTQLSSVTRQVNEMEKKIEQINILADKFELDRS